MTDASNWLSAAASRPISVTRKREKCVLTPATSVIIEAVTGSSTELEDGVIMPRRLRFVVIRYASFDRPSSPLKRSECKSLKLLARHGR